MRISAKNSGILTSHSGVVARFAAGVVVVVDVVG